jgi:hypothetical protein
MSQNGCGTTTLNPQPLGGSDWAQLEAGTLRFRDPLNKDRRFIPLRLDDAPIQAPWRSSFTPIGSRRTVRRSRRGRWNPASGGNALSVQANGNWLNSGDKSA